MYIFRPATSRAVPRSHISFPHIKAPTFTSPPCTRPFASFMPPRPLVISRSPPIHSFLPRRHSSTSTVAPKRSSFQEAFERQLNFPLRTWIVAGFVLFIYGAGLVIMSTSDFVAYSDAESLKQFTPTEPAQVEIENYINNHPLVKTLRSKPEFTESRPTMKVKETYRSASLTSGVLAGPGKIEVPPYMWIEEGGKTSVQVMYLGQDLCGHPGIVHGGLLATLLDEGLARCSFPAMPNKTGLTANLTINYRAPVMANQYVVLRAKTVKVEGRKAWVEGHIETLVDEGEEPKKLVEASVLMIEPKNAKVLTKLINHP